MFLFQACSKGGRLKRVLLNQDGCNMTVAWMHAGAWAFRRRW